MARPKAKELTERELEVMHACWRVGEATVADIRDELARGGRDLAYTTVATLVRILTEKGYVKQATDERPFRFRPIRSFEDVSGRLVRELIHKVFGGSREALLVRLMDEQTLTAKERELLNEILKKKKS